VEDIICEKTKQYLMQVGTTLKQNGKNLLGPACARLVWVSEALSLTDKNGTFRKSIHKGLVNGASLVAEHFPMTPSNNVRENIDLTVVESKPNLWEQILDKDGNHQKNCLWAFRMLEEFLKVLGPI